MGSDLCFYELVLFGLLWLWGMLHWVRPYNCAPPGRTLPTPATPPRKRSGDPKPFPGLRIKPHCAACEQAAREPAAPPPPALPPRLSSSRGRPRQVDTSQQFCPNPDCASQGRVALGNISATGHPGGGPWRQLHCSACAGYFQETVRHEVA